VDRGALSGRSARRQSKNFVALYASTAAGTEATEYLTRLPTDEPPPPAPADVIAQFGRDFKLQSPGSGWRYMCNVTDAIGTAAKYQDLVWNDGQKSYAAHTQAYPVNEPPGWVRLSADTSHPGRGAGQGVGFDRYAIAAYTLDAAKSGKMAITGSLQRRAADGTIELRIYVNDTLKENEKTDGSSNPLDFALLLGTLNGGDTVYVAIGPDGQDAMDSCAVDFTIYTVR
ncbi:MAG: hypothetical protein NTW87_34425, partial [Planctomycetota bacterium]|nr:hypothetical protein [Planctomycetota bacterium]